MRDDDDMDRLIQHLTSAIALAQALHKRSTHRLLAMALVDLGQDIAASSIEDEQVSDIVA